MRESGMSYGAIDPFVLLLALGVALLMQSAIWWVLSHYTRRGKYLYRAFAFSSWWPISFVVILVCWFLIPRGFDVTPASVLKFFFAATVVLFVFWTAPIASFETLRIARTRMERLAGRSLPRWDSGVLVLVAVYALLGVAALLFVLWGWVGFIEMWRWPPEHSATAPSSYDISAEVSLGAFRMMELGVLLWAGLLMSFVQLGQQTIQTISEEDTCPELDASEERADS